MRIYLAAVVVLCAGCGQPAATPGSPSERSPSEEASASQPFAEFRGAPEVARAAVRTWAAKGPAAIDELNAALQDDSMKVQARAREALSMITGQWGGDGRLMWQRSVKDAVGGDKPLMVLHLFGNFDEEFC